MLLRMITGEGRAEEKAGKDPQDLWLKTQQTKTPLKKMTFLKKQIPSDFSFNFLSPLWAFIHKTLCFWRRDFPLKMVCLAVTTEAYSQTLNSAGRVFYKGLYMR